MVPSVGGMPAAALLPPGYSPETTAGAFTLPTGPLGAVPVTLTRSAGGDPASARGRLRQLPRTTAYLLLNLPVGLGLFVATVTGVSVGIGLTGAFFVGIPLVVLTLLLVRRLGEVERTRARALLGAVVDDPPELPRTGHPVARVRALLGDDGTWRALAYALVALPWGVFTASMTLTLWVAGIGYSTFPVWWWATGGTADPGLGWWPAGWGDVAVVAVVGFALLALAVLATLGLGAASAGLVRGLLGPSQAQRDRRVADLTTSRRRVVDGAATERRRIERDLHDGAQQRLVGLALTLGRADRDLAAGDLDAGRALVTQARGEATDALTELRNLVRGIHPAVLGDRGLDAALSAVTARSPLPVLLDVDPGVTLQRPDPLVEEAAYFVVTEALANATKHAAARAVSVDVRRLGGCLLVSVDDDGRGGASLRDGGGLAGLADRVGALDGALTVTSPRGGPTRVTATLPG